MRGFWKAAFLGVPFASALVIPDSWETAGQGQEDGDIAPALTNGHDDTAHAIFGISCPTCSDDGAEGNDRGNLTFKFDTVFSVSDCDTATIAINDLALVPFHGVTGSGSTGFFQVPSARSGSDQVDIVSGLWNLNCPSEPETGRSERVPNENDESRVRSFAVNVTSVNGKPVDRRTGFEVAFKNSPFPSVLRVLDTFSGVEKQPSSNARGAIDSSGLGLSYSSNPETSPIKQQRKELQFLIAEADRINRAITVKKHRIDSQFRGDFNTLAKGVKGCPSLKCIKQGVVRHFKHILNGTKKAIKTVCSKWRHAGLHHHLSTFASDSRSDTPPSSTHYSPVDHSSPSSVPSEPYEGPPNPQESSTSVAGGPGPKQPDPLAPFQSKTLHPVSQSSAPSESLPPSHSFSHWHWNSRTHDSSSSVGVALEPTDSNDAGSERLAKTPALFAALSGATHGGCGGSISGDLAPLLTLIERESVLEDAMQVEISSLQSAAEMVTSLVSLEEGRAGQGGVAHGDRTMVPPLLVRQDSLPDYTSETNFSEPPPTYDDNDGSELSGLVVDGFQYAPPRVPSPTELWTPSTSIADSSENSLDGGSDDGRAKD
ncbi:MAG: hypothetical protein M1837_000638 [Sclerophora amabilis]|nr:MAG: hypothetical protein M1837_000638 [Sclerophora amabilis]